MESPGQKAPDPRLQPTPDYGTLGPGSDINPAAASNAGADPTAHPSALASPLFVPARNAAKPAPQAALAVVAIAVGIALAAPLIAMGGPHKAWQRFQDWLSLQGKPEAASPAILSEHDLDRLDRQPAQKAAELLLERALNHYDGANDQIAQRVDQWHGRLKMTPNLNALISAALNSNDLRVRAAGIELQLAAYNIPKTPAEGQQMRDLASSADHTTKIWALWTLGALANRGVEPDSITETLVGHLKDDDASSRQWAVEGLALVGSDATILPLLGTFRDDPSPAVRERAACSLAQSGMLTQDQRMTAVPTILTYTDDPSLDARTHTWAFQALRDITAQNLPNDPSAWRDWFQSRSQQAR
jgi:hypothetical protein